MPIPFHDGITLVPLSSAGPPTTGDWEAGTLVIDANGLIYICQASGTPGTWGQPTGWPSLDGSIYNQPDFYDSFVNGLQTGMGWQTALSGGTITAVAKPAGLNHGERVVGIAQASTGGGTTGRAGAMLGASLVRFDADVSVRIQTTVNIPVLSVSNQRFQFRAGALDSITNALPTDGLYFSYDDSISPNWMCMASSNSSRTQVNSGVPVNVNDWVDLRIDWWGGSNGANMFINDAWVAWMSLNIPKSVGRETSIGFALNKISGGTARVVNLDRFLLRVGAG